jgi:hypothetical protein
MLFLVDRLTVVSGIEDNCLLIAQLIDHAVDKVVDVAAGIEIVVVAAVVSDNGRRAQQ